MRQGLIFTLLTLLGCVTTSCNQLMDYAEEDSAYSYNFNVNGCTTGEKNFSTREAMCDALTDDSLNNNCAENERYTKFLSDCPGRTWQTLEQPFDETTSF